MSVSIESLLPSYISNEDKNRLQKGLSQFAKDGNLDYSSFFSIKEYPDYLQCDILEQIRMPHWNGEQYDKVYTQCMIVSNSCDISAENNRTSANTKECLFAPLVDFKEYIEELVNEAVLNKEQIDAVAKKIKTQKATNLFYIPPISDVIGDKIAYLDTLFWIPTSELNSYIKLMRQLKIVSLSRFGHYLFLVKASHHISRLPEEDDNRA